MNGSEPVLRLGLDFFQGIAGRGSISFRNQDFPASFSLEILPDYSIRIQNAINPDQRTALHWAMGELDAQFRDDIGLVGSIEQGYDIRCERAVRRNSSCSLEDEPTTMSLSAEPKTRIVIEHQGPCKEEGGCVTFGITNLDFSLHPHLNFHVGSYDIHAVPVPEYGRLIRQIKKGQIPRAIVYEFRTEIKSCAELQDLEETIYNLTLMLSLVTHNDIKPFYSLIQNEQGDVLRATLYTDLRDANFISFFKMIDDEHISGGIERYVNCCYDNFKLLRERMNLHPFVYDLLFASRISEIHIATVVMILGLEYLVTHFGRSFLDWEPSRNQTLLGKLRRLNTVIRCIPSRFLDDSWTDRIRNPLIHTGVIVDISSEELITAFYDLHRLTSLVFLRLVGYSGLFLNYSYPPEVNRILETSDGNVPWGR